MGTGMEKEYGAKNTRAWAWQGWVTPWEEGCRGEKNSRVKGLSSPALDDLLGGKKRVLVPVDR